MDADTLRETDDPRAQLYRAIAAAYHASEALLRAQDRYGKNSPEAAAAHAQVDQAKDHLLQYERAYMAMFTPAPARRRRSARRP